MFLPEVKSRFDEDISILLKLDNYSHNFICDCGDASDLTVKECQNTEAVFISHTHIDHFINFDFILRHQIGIGKRVVICGPEGITRQVQSKIRGYQWNLISEDAITYEIREILSSGRIIRSEMTPPVWDIIELPEIDSPFIFQHKRFTVEFVILDHKTASIAYLFKEHDSVKIDLSKGNFKGGSWVRDLKTAYEEGNDSTLIKIDEQAFKASDLFYMLEIKKGDTLGVIMDHAAHQINHDKIKGLFHGCNKVFIECFYKAEDEEFAKLNFHSYSKASARIMKTCEVKSAVPVHFSRKYKEEEVEELLSEFCQEFDPSMNPPISK